jgi:hypothetical protein
MRWGPALVVVATAGCAETVQAPAAKAQSNLSSDTSACLTIPPSSHPGCYHPTPPPPDPRFSVALAEPGTGLSHESINEVVRPHLAAIKCCYQTQLGRDPELAGDVVVAWTIEPSGGVSRAWIVERTLGSQPAVDCIGEEICGWAFPPAEAPTMVGRYPIIFKGGR